MGRPVTVPYPFPPLVPDDPEIVAERLAAALQAAWDDLAAEHQRVVDTIEAGRREPALRWLRDFLAAVEHYQAEVEAQARAFVTGHLPARYRAGALTVGQGFAWTQAHTEALVSLASDTYADFLGRSQQAGQTSARFAAAVRRGARVEVPKGVAGGRTPEQAGRRLAERLRARGIHAVTYADGSRHTVGEWAHVAAVTKSGVAANVGTLNRSVEAGSPWVEVFDGPGCGWGSHNDGDKAGGSIRHATEAQSHPLSHPRCRRAFGPRPDVRTQRDAKLAEPVGPTVALRAVSEPAPRRDRDARRAALVARRARRTGQVDAAAPTVSWDDVLGTPSEGQGMT